jgi:uncharacterized protein YecT (DUF1311 family)
MGSTNDCSACELERLARADQALNAVYAAQLAKLGPRQAAKLRDAERAWIAYRDASCAAAADIGACDESGACGTIERLTYPSCLTTKTKERTAELRAMTP